MQKLSWCLGPIAAQRLLSVHFEPPEKWKDPGLTQKLPAAELDSLELQHRCWPGRAGVPCPGEAAHWACAQPPLTRYWVDGYVCVFLLEIGQDWC